MKVSSHNVETPQLGNLHITRFTPSNASEADLGVHFGGVYSRSTTIDTFGTAYILAAERGMTVDVIDRPGLGSSTLPENTHLRDDYRRYGFVAVREAIIEAQVTSGLYRGVNHIHASGMSLGGAPAVQYLRATKDLAASAVLIDSADIRIKASTSQALGRYFAYLGLESAYSKLKLKPKVNEVFEIEPDILTAYCRFRDEYPKLPVNPELNKENKKVEFKELCRLAEGKGINELVTVMQAAVDKERELEVRVSRSSARIISDHQSVRFINRTLDLFDANNEEQSCVRYGFLQETDHWWHDLAIAPNTIRKLIKTPIEQLRSRLR